MKQGLDHALHLMLAGASMADDSFLGARGGVLGDQQPFSCSGENRHALGHAQFDRALRIVQDKLRLDGKSFRMVLLDEQLDALKDNAIALGKG